MFQKILFPTDGSPASVRAAEALANLLREDRATRVTLAVAYTPIDLATTDFDAAAADMHNEMLQKQAHRYLMSAATTFEEHGIPLEFRLLTGRPVSTVIAREAETGDYDAVVMGSRGMGMEESTDNYLGSVTEHVIRKVSRPVIVIPLRPS